MVLTIAALGHSLLRSATTKVEFGAPWAIEISRAKPGRPFTRHPGSVILTALVGSIPRVIRCLSILLNWAFNAHPLFKEGTVRAYAITGEIDDAAASDATMACVICMIVAFGIANFYLH